MTAPPSEPATTGTPGFCAAEARRSTRPVVVFDLGGTWFRAGVLVDGDTVAALRRHPAVTRAAAPATAAVLQQRIVDWLVRTLDEIRLEWPTALDLCAVSLGAAMDGRTGHVVGSAPLFGSERTDWWPARELSARRPDARWSVVNDVSALAYALLGNDRLDQRRQAAAVTVSTGIAYRTIDLASGRIPLDREHGLQGEIGHLPAQLHWDGAPVTARCDCGAPDHVASFSSGAGIGRFLRSLPAAVWGGTDTANRSTAQTLASFGGLVAQGHRGALRVLDAVTLPLARVLLAQAALNPEVEHTVLTGGVVDNLGDAYLASLLRNLNQLGLYGISDRDQGYFARRIVRGQPNGLNALRGAGVHARGILNERAHTA
ncbi:ROK family protein [Kitasatospora sp. NPDC052868]|uniref:ROK family protein n=1 Tax=Kitasatospora sp. NPDC052868 TaxID=3364060 RepID=UPI0037CB1489